MRRAMSCATWEPKSRMRMRSRPGFERPSGAAAPLLREVAMAESVDVVIGRLLRDLHVVHVGLAHAGGRDLHELGPGAHLLDGPAPGVAHARTQPAHELQHDGGGGALVGNAS